MNRTRVWTPLWSEGLIIGGKVGEFWKVEDAVMQKSKHRGQKKQHGLQGTMEGRRDLDTASWQEQQHTFLENVVTVEIMSGATVNKVTA